ncbi:MAG TPA: glutamine--tRNA ligase, partial [Opitutae bacterium]|nr:glutamine--tRNA ligase [Opitutae bacterium]
IQAAFDPESRGGSTPDGRKVKGTIHWVSATENVPLEVRAYEQLFLKPNPDDAGEGQTFLDNLNSESEKVIRAYGELELAGAEPGDRFQFERKGYYTVDPDSTTEALVFNQTVTLRDSWAKKQKK